MRQHMTLSFIVSIFYMCSQLLILTIALRVVHLPCSYMISISYSLQMSTLHFTVTIVDQLLT